MKKVFGKKQDNLIIIDGEEREHLAVLRCTQNEEILCFCGDKYQYHCTIIEQTKKQVVAKINSSSVCKGNPTKNITVFQGLPKGDKLDLITQKLCELGVSKIVPFESSFTIAKPNQNKIQRLNKVSKEACKQCGRSLPLIVEDTVSFKQMLEMLKQFQVVLFANEKDRLAQNSIENAENIAIIIGSEGGFSQKEIEDIISSGAICVGLGERILRTETASIALSAIVCHMLKI